MKRFVLITLFITLYIGLQAQNLPFVQDQKVWKTYFDCDHPNWERNMYGYSFQIDGDTIIGGRICSKMHVTTLLENGDEGEAQYLTALYEEEGKVYFVPKDSEDGLLMYDFSASAGDLITVYSAPSINPFFPIDYHIGTATLRVLETKTEVYEGVERKCLYVVGESNYQTYLKMLKEEEEQYGPLSPEEFEEFQQSELWRYCGWLVEGLGVSGRAPNENTNVGIMWDYGLVTWLCAVESDTLYYNARWDIATGIDEVKCRQQAKPTTNRNDHHSSIYNLNGTRQQTLQKGLNIICEGDKRKKVYRKY